MANVTRRQGREWAVQMLFQMDLNPGIDVDKMIKDFWQQQWSYRVESDPDRIAVPPGSEEEDQPSLEEIPGKVAPKKIRDFAEIRVRGVLEHLDEIDEMISTHAKNWEMFRIGSVERNVLRLSVYELKYCDDVPNPVIMNEAVDLAKYFSNSEAGRFVNGVLDKIRKDLA